MLADAADSIYDVALPGPRPASSRRKPDLTPVSDADRAAEEAIRSTCSRARPRDAVTGEEFGDTGHGPRRWVLDPIDGTKNFVRGVPVWATLIALMDGDDVVAGLVSAPALGRRWWAAHRARRVHRQEPVGRQPDGGLGGRAGSTTPRCPTPAFAAGTTSAARTPFLGLTRDVWRSRAYGDFWSYMLVAEGAVDVAAEPEVALYDLAAPSIVVTEAGGRFTDLDGHRGPGGGSAVATNGHLHDEVVARLTPASRLGRRRRRAGRCAPAGVRRGLRSRVPPATMTARPHSTTASCTPTVAASGPASTCPIGMATSDPSAS